MKVASLALALLGGCAALQPLRTMGAQQRGGASSRVARSAMPVSSQRSIQRRSMSDRKMVKLFVEVVGSTRSIAKCRASYAECRVSVARASEAASEKDAGEADGFGMFALRANVF